jgi:hypothetical protein
MPKQKRGGKTMKKHSKQSGSTLTIPELRSSMEYITSYSENLVRSSSKSVKELAKEFAAEWKKIFGKSLDLKAAEQYIKHMKAMKGSKKTRKQRGGTYSDAAGAPLDYLTRPGVNLPYGNFLQYVDKGFWNPEPAILKDCGTQQGVLPYPETGSNKMNGGGLLDALSNTASAFSFRPFIAQNPPSVQQDLQTAWKGQPLGPGPESWQQAWKPMMGAQMPPLSPIATYDRNLSIQGPV